MTDLSTAGHGGAPGRGADAVVLTDARVVLPDSVLRNGWVAVDGGRIVAVGRVPSEPPPFRRVPLAGGTVLPGFVDLHVHGGGGASFGSEDPDEVAAAAAFHLGCGTTALLASLVSEPVPRMARQAATIATVIERGTSTVAGVHLEGPFLAPGHRGAHDLEALREPDVGVLDALLAAARGTVRVVTLAPELPGGLDLVRRVVAAGAVAAVGHTGASAAQVADAVDAGARLATHLFNAMRPLHHREPGTVGGLLARPEVVCELVNDGVHVDPRVVRLAVAAAGPGRTVLVTDAIAAAGTGDGDLRMGGLTVQVRDGVARVAGTDTIAGSTLTMAGAVRRAVVDVGMALPDVAAAASATPARVLGLAAEIGSLSPGKRADLVVMDDALELVDVMRAGAWVHGAVDPA